jgi:DNA-3-methyladenine glycosylase
LPRSFFARPTPELALALLGVRLVRRWESGAVSTGLIVEVEAYGGPEDRASHARSGPTRRNAAMFGPAGHAYVYRVYGVHACLNAVGAADGAVGAVLIRAVMPELGPEALVARRTAAGRSVPPLARLAAGPGNVTAAFGIGLESDGLDLTAGAAVSLVASEREVQVALMAAGVVCGPRVGVGHAGPDRARPWRFGVRGHPALSRAFPRGA